MAVKKSELYSSLWESCNQLRGGMDASQYKDYVLVVLFLKYISDKAKVEKDYLLEIPEGCTWDDILALRGKKDIGEKLNEIIHCIAENNELGGVIDTADFNDDAKLGKEKDKVDTLSNLISAFQKDSLDFSNNRAGDDDLLGDAYEYLMKNFASESGKSKGQFYTPGEVSRVMAKVIGIHEDNEEGITIYDPTCGSGSLLLRAWSESLHPENTSLFGQEKDINNVGMAKMNMILHGYECSDIRLGDTLNSPQFTKGRNLDTFNYIVANPPFSQKSWLKTAKANDLYGRWGNGIVDENQEEEYNPTPASIGVPPEKCGDYAFLLHIIKSMKETGKGACILPHGVLFRGNAEAEIRKNIIQAGYIKGIIGLPSNLFYGTGIPACIILLDKKEAKERKGIFIIDAKDGFVKDGNKNRLREEDIQRIVDTWQAFEDVPYYARFVSNEEIAKNEYNLNIPRYVTARDKEIVQDIEAHLKGGLPQHDIDQLEEYWKSMPSLKDQLVKLGDKGYYSWVVSKEQIDDVINENEDYQVQLKAVNHTMSLFLEQWQTTFYDLAENYEKPKQLIERVGLSIRNIFEQEVRLIDPYDAYEQLMNYWAETMQDDVYMIAADGWKLDLHPKTKLNKKKEVTEVKVMGYTDLECDLLPVDFVVDVIFQEELQVIRDKESALSSFQESFDNLLEEKAEYFDESNFASNKINATTIKKRLKVVNGEEKEALQEYNELKNSIKTAKAELKDASNDLVEKVKKEYEELNKNETPAKNMVIKKWHTAISTRIQSELNRSIELLKSQLSAIADRYDETLPTIDKEVEEYESKVVAHLAKMGFTF